MSSGPSRDSGLIYVLQDPRSWEIRYVGQTTASLERRLYLHCFRSPTKPVGDSHRERWVHSLLQAGVSPVISLVQEVPLAELDSAEIYWIAYFRSAGCDLVNTHPGGNGGWQHMRGRPGWSSGKPKGVETKQKIRESLLGRKLPETTKLKMRAARARDRDKIAKASRDAWIEGRGVNQWTMGTADRTPQSCPECGRGPYKGTIGLNNHLTKMHRSEISK